MVVYLEQLENYLKQPSFEPVNFFVRRNLEDLTKFVNNVKGKNPNIDVSFWKCEDGFNLILRRKEPSKSNIFSGIRQYFLD